MKISRSGVRVRATGWLWVLSLVLILTLVWCAAYHRWTAQAWATPITYTSDALWGMAVAKALASGEIVPVWPKYVSALGAPFGANWNDYPSAEEGVFAWSGLLARIFGVFAGANLLVFSAHVLAAVAFFFVCRHLRYDPIFALAGALVFAFSRYAFSRSLLHATLTYYWHIPLALLVVWWCVAEEALLNSRKRFAGALIIAVLHGMQNPYYSWMFVQLLGLAAVWQLVRRAPSRVVLAPVVLLGVVGLTFLLMNADTFYSRLVNAPAAEVVARNYQGLEFYALKPIELLLPVVHNLDGLHNWARRAYFAQTMLIGEAGSPYLGIVGILALAWLVWTSLKAVARPQVNALPAHFWVILWILLYAVVGGINGIVGLFFELFRGSNRYSIFILAVLLLFLVRQLSRSAAGWPIVARGALATGIVAVALFDQIPPAPSAGIAPVRAEVMADREIVERIESQLPAGAMIFQLPVAPFPEAGVTGGMGDYEHLRPYLHSRRLRFSYGSVKGRTREAWQKEVESLGVTRGVQRLESYGFSAVWINRSGYPDGGAALAEQLRSLGRNHVLGENADFVCIALNPSPQPTLPPEFASGWHEIETGGENEWRWSSGDAVLVLHNDSAAEKALRVTFELRTGAARKIDVIANGRSRAAFSLEAGGRAVIDERIVLAQGRNVIRFETDVPGEVPTNGDPRRLAFALWNLRILD